jgi:hypothetical protein
MAMLKRAMLLVVCVVLVVAAGCGKKEKPKVVKKDSTKHYFLDDNKLALKGYSPVSYFESGKAEKGSPEFQVVHRGVVYHLTSAEQVAKFKADPEKHKPAFGGWCAYCCSGQKRVFVDPEAFKIVNGRLLLFVRTERTDALSLWNATIERDVPDELSGDARKAKLAENEAKLIQKADAYWKKVSGE